VLLVHYLIQWPAYRKSKALSLSERAYWGSGQNRAKSSAFSAGYAARSSLAA
jgi:hypothetical protein